MKNLRGLFAALMKSPAVPIATVMTVAFMAAAGLAFLPLAHAAPADKVWVCKYVGTPGVNETLKDGGSESDLGERELPQGQGLHRGASVCLRR